ncbi:hypothetical protein SCA6_018357 [Theobroma cacao]
MESKNTSESPSKRQNMGLPFSLLQFCIICHCFSAFKSDTICSTIWVTLSGSFALLFIPTIWIILCMWSLGACNQKHHLSFISPCGGQFGKTSDGMEDIWESVLEANSRVLRACHCFRSYASKLGGK